MKKLLSLFALFVLCSGIMFAQTEGATQSGEKKTEKKEKKPSKVGSFLRKAGEVTTGINMTDEPFIINTLSGYKAEFISCVGDPNSGTVSVTFNLKHNLVPQAIYMSGGSNTYAVDKKGNQFRGGGEKIVMDSHTNRIGTNELSIRTITVQNVPLTLDAFEVIHQHVVSENKEGAGNRQVKELEFRNIPIDWGTAN